MVIIQKFWVINEQQQAFAEVVRHGQLRVSHPCSLKTGAGRYDYHAIDFHLHYSGAEMNMLHSMMSQLNIMTSTIHQILVCHKDHIMGTSRMETLCSLMIDDLRLFGQ